VRAGQESAEAIVAKMAGESRQERRAEEPRDQPQNSGKERSEKSSETVLERQLKGHFQDCSEGEKGVELPREPTDGRRARRQANQVHEGSPKVQLPDAANRTSGGVGGSRCAITVTRPDSSITPSAFRSQITSRNHPSSTLAVIGILPMFPEKMLVEQTR
jgi:hypothetical protein